MEKRIVEKRIVYDPTVEHKKPSNKPSNKPIAPVETNTFETKTPETKTPAIAHAEVEKPKVETPKPEKGKNAKTSLLEERILAAMTHGVSYTSTALRDNLKLEQKSGRSAVRHAMRRLAKEGKVTVTAVNHGAKQKFTYQRK
jgi:hypothetical protein